MYDVYREGVWNGFGPPEREPLPDVGATWVADDVTVDHDARIAAVFDSHVAVSNGKAEARVFALDPQPRGPSADLLRALRLDCLHDAVVVEVRAITAAELLRALFAIAAHGGDYNTARSRAYARRDAWRSLGGLVDAPLDARSDEVEPLVRGRGAADAILHVHSPDAAWFYHVVCDLGVAVLREGGESIAVLAGTDSD